MTCFVLFSDLKGRGNDLSEAMVFHSAGAVDKGSILTRSAFPSVRHSSVIKESTLLFAFDITKMGVGGP